MVLLASDHRNEPGVIKGSSPVTLRVSLKTNLPPGTLLPVTITGRREFSLVGVVLDIDLDKKASDSV